MYKQNVDGEIQFQFSNIAVCVMPDLSVVKTEAGSAADEALPNAFSICTTPSKESSTKRKHISYDSLEIPQEMQVDQDVKKNAKPGKKSKKLKNAKNAFK